jgi:hypothetical protein
VLLRCDGLSKEQLLASGDCACKQPTVPSNICALTTNAPITEMHSFPGESSPWDPIVTQEELTCSQSGLSQMLAVGLPSYAFLAQLPACLDIEGTLKVQFLVLHPLLGAACSQGVKVEASIAAGAAKVSSISCEIQSVHFRLGPGP